MKLEPGEFAGDSTAWKVEGLVVTKATAPAGWGYLVRVDPSHPWFDKAFEALQNLRESGENPVELNTWIRVRRDGTCPQQREATNTPWKDWPDGEENALVLGYRIGIAQGQK